MIVSRTPLRISFVGGGSDLASFYRKRQGAVVTTTINKYIYITVNKKFDDSIRLSYSVTENVKNINGLKHLLAKETLRFLGIKKGIEITSIGDIPAETGLGTSGAYTVGLLHALSYYLGTTINKAQLAQYASIIEIDKVKRPIGKQDQYIESFGGFNFIQFNTDETVSVIPIKLSKSQIIHLQENLLLLYTGDVQDSSVVLSKQNTQLQENFDKFTIMSQMVDLAWELKGELKKGNLDATGHLMHKNWLLKKQLTPGISNSKIDDWYDKALALGALGGKICGAGGRGFLLLYAPKLRHAKICKELPELHPVDFTFEQSGSTIVYK